MKFNYTALNGPSFSYTAIELLLKMPKIYDRIRGTYSDSVTVVPFQVMTIPRPEELNIRYWQKKTEKVKMQ